MPRLMQYWNALPEQWKELVKYSRKPFVQLIKKFMHHALLPEKATQYLVAYYYYQLPVCIKNKLDIFAFEDY